MTQRRRATIKQGAVTDVMSCLSELPERGKAPDKAVSLAEIFRTKEYIAEIKRALKKGYTFDDLAAIFSERCGVNVSARQLKYHCTREKNKRAKNNAEGKSNRPGRPKSAVPPGNPAPASPGSEAEGDAGDIGASTNVLPIPLKSEAFVTSDAEAVSAETGTFPFEKRL